MDDQWIPLPLLFRFSDVRSVKISPDGRRLALLRSLDDVQNVWLAPVEAPERMTPLTRLKGHGVKDYFWAYDGRHILTLQDQEGDENWRIYATDVATGQRRCLTPEGEVQARIVGVSPHHPEQVVVELNDRDPRWHDLYRLDIRTGERELLVHNNMEVAGWLVDEHLQPAVGQRFRDDGGGELLVFRDGRWERLMEWDVRHAFTIEPLAFRGGRLYMLSTIGHPRQCLVAVNAADGTERVLAEDPHYDVGVGTMALGAPFLFHPRSERPDAVAVNRDKQAWVVLNPALRSAFDALADVEPGRQFGVTSRDLADEKWVVAVDGDQQSVHYYLMDRRTGDVRLLYRARPALEQYPLVERRPVRFPGDDGLWLEGYVSLPRGRKRPPLVAYVHGGPWYRDSWGFEAIVQWLANRGFAVLQVNFRGSTGYGHAFILKSIKEWGGKMLDDVTAGVRHLMDGGLVDPQKVGILGGSFGGYSTLAGLAFAPETYGVGVDIVGPSNLFTFLESIPPYWEAYRSILYHFVGHPEKDAALLQARSPLFHVDRMRAPLLIGQGANDPRVKRAESIQIVEALQQKGHPVEYVEYPDEGHGFYRTANQLDFFGRAERFLLKHLR